MINTTLQQIFPCKDDLKILASIGDERIKITPNTPTVAELEPSLSLFLWNGLFVHKDTPADVREKIAAVAKKNRPVRARPKVRYRNRRVGLLEGMLWRPKRKSRKT